MPIFLLHGKTGSGQVEHIKGDGLSGEWMREIYFREGHHMVAVASELSRAKSSDISSDWLQHPIAFLVTEGLFDDAAFPGIQRLVPIKKDEIHRQVRIHPIKGLGRRCLYLDPE